MKTDTSDAFKMTKKRIYFDISDRRQDELLSTETNMFMENI